MSHTLPIQAVFFDVDGTLISYDTHKIPQTTIDALRAVREQGVKVVVATGRPLHIMGFLDEWFTFDATITMNGQLCFADGECIRRHTFAREDIATLLKIVDRHGYPCMLLEEDRKYISRVTDTVREHFASIQAPVPPVVDISRALTHDIFQIVIYATPEQEQEVLDALPDFQGIRAAPNCLDIIPWGGGKPRGMRAVLDHFGIPLEASMAFGDGMNDITMLAYAGIGVAMGNGEPSVKEVADYVTRTVDEGGVLHAFEHFGLYRRA